jgi:outer membrane protein TolC
MALIFVVLATAQRAASQTPQASGPTSSANGKTAPLTVDTSIDPANSRPTKTQFQPVPSGNSRASISKHPAQTKKAAGMTPIGADNEALPQASKQSAQFQSSLQKQSPLPDSGQGSNQGTGEAVTPSNLADGPRAKDLDLIQQQQQLFNERFLIGEAIELALPKPSELMSLGGKLGPIRLEAAYTEPVSLKDVLRYAVDNNLSIRLTQATVESNKYLLWGNFGAFLPNILMNYQQQYLAGSTYLGGIVPVTYNTPNVSLSAGFQFFGFQGGRVLFNTLSQLAVYRAAKHALTGSLNDTLLNTSIGYYNLMRNQALLQIQTRAVEVSRAQVLLNQQLEDAGTGTKFQVLQSQTQLANDEQNLLNQEVALRTASIDLATLLNLQQGVNLLSVEQEVKKVRLIDPKLDITGLMAIAIENRPELKQYEQLRIAARRNIQVAMSQFYPQFNFYGSESGNGPTLSNTKQITPGYFSPVATTTPVAASVTNTLIPNSLSSTTRATNIATKEALAKGTASQETAEVYVPAQQTTRQVQRSYTIGIQATWTFNNAGVPYLTTVLSNRALARQAMLNSNQQLLTVGQQVRESYLTSMAAERQIEVTTKAVLSGAEELRLARVRLANGVGTNLDVINAQRDFTTALVNKADAIIQFNIAQAQLLHDMGVISVDNVVSGRLVTR